MLMIFFLLLSLFPLSSFAKMNEFDVEKKTAVKLFENYLKEVDRLDGDGLLPRQNRKLSWKEITTKLKIDLKNSQTKMELGRVFVRLDAAYTNLHAHIRLNPDYDFASEGRLNLAASFQPEFINADGSVPRYLLANVRKEYFIHLEPENRPQKGDELIEINHRPIKKWSDENFEFCKFPLKSQCEYDFWGNFRKGNLSWHRRQALIYTLKRQNKKIDVQIPVFVRVENKSLSSSADDKPTPCGNEPDKYPQFEMVYQGYQACVYENKNIPDTAILRIRSFRYKKGEVVNEIDHVSKEVERFAKKYWDKKSQTIKLLVIDVIENGGGDIVTDWSAQFLNQSFQDQWVQFKKTKELEDLNWRKDAFYDDKGKYRIYDNLKASEKWQQIKDGDFIPPMPQFCYSNDGDCLTEKFPVQKAAYKGKIVILTDPWCISSCVGFVWTLKHYLKDRVQFAGIPDSGDSTYSRTYIEGSLVDSGKGFKLAIYPRPPQSRAEVADGALFRAAISTSRSTDENGNIISGVPMKMDYFSSPKWDEAPEDWIGRMVRETTMDSGLKAEL